VLIYNHKKEFIGIDEEDLRNLGLNSLSQLLSECTNFADLFVKKPGYIHNFKNFEWIDFVLHAEAEESKAIIHVREKSYSCNILIESFFLTQNPTEAAFSIKLQQIRPLNATEGAEIAKEVAANPKPKPAPIAVEETPSAPIEVEEKVTVLPDFDSLEPTVLETPDPYDVPEDVTFDPYAKNSLDVDEDIFVTEPTPFIPEAEAQAQLAKDEEEKAEKLQAELVEKEKIAEEEANAPAPMLGDYINSEEQGYIDNLKTPDDYKYDPNVAAEELGLPVDLIEEFIGDFIQQAHEFKEEIFDANNKEDLDEVKILSHKLKGVAANLRIEDAFEVLSIVNTSEDSAEIEANLKQFYKMVSKLEGKEVIEEVPASTPIAEETIEDSFALDEDLNAFDSVAETSEDIVVNSDTEEDIYDFNINDNSHEEVELPPMPTLDDDIYSFDLVQEEDKIPAQTASTEDESDLYEFDLKQPEDGPLIVMEDQLKPTKEEDEEDNFVNPFNEEDSFKSDDVITPESVIPSISYNVALASAEIGLPEALVSELIEDLKTDVETSRDELIQAVSNNDTRAWQAVALKIKGITDNLRINELSPTILGLLKADNADSAQAKIDELYTLINQL